MVRVYCDFDGTVCPQDVGNKLFRTYAGERVVEIVEEYFEDRITSRECLRRECEAVQGLGPQEFRTFIGQFAVDTRFPAFAAYCAARDIPVTILSDGLDLYVHPMLAEAGFAHLPAFANKGTFVPAGSGWRLTVEFPYTDAECDRCGNCKRNHMLTTSGENDVLVYVGDGISDRCPVRYADIVFARRDLIAYCQRQNITYHRFEHFGDVQAKLDDILTAGRPRQRREAAMARRDVFLQG